MNRTFQYMPNLSSEELAYISMATEKMSDEALRHFATAYQTRRKDPQTTLILAVLGLLGLGGIHRFYMGHIGLGILYLLTAGLCYIGTIIDLINHRDLALNANKKLVHNILKGI